jgi:ATP/maltotriose-dependent transcriptional regulator MalT
VVAQRPLAEVSARERPVLGLIAEGTSNQAIALPESADQNPNG